mgnify:FL=1
MNHAELASQAQNEQDKLRTELKEILDQMSYTALMENDAKIAEAASTINSTVPLKIFVG